MASGGILLSGADNEDARLVTFAFVKPAIMFRTAGNGGVYSRIATRYDRTDAIELYVRSAFSALRVDDTGVRMITFHNEDPLAADPK